MLARNSHDVNVRDALEALDEVKQRDSMGLAAERGGLGLEGSGPSGTLRTHAFPRLREPNPRPLPEPHNGGKQTRPMGRSPPYS